MQQVVIRWDTNIYIMHSSLILILSWNSKKTTLKEMRTDQTLINYIKKGEMIKTGHFSLNQTN